MLTSLVRPQRDSIVYGHCLPALASLANLGLSALPGGSGAHDLFNVVAGHDTRSA